MRLKSILIGISIFLLISFNVFAVNVSITSSDGNGKDKYCDGSCYNTEELIVNTGVTSRMYVMFDVSDIPQNADIITAVMLFKFKASDIVGESFAKLFIVDSGWQEDDGQQPLSGTYIGMLNNISCEICDDPKDWFGFTGTQLLNTIKSMVSGGSNDGFIISESNLNFTTYSSESTDFKPFLYLIYESDCDDEDNDGFGIGDCIIGGDCNDSNANINPNGTEICNLFDDDCNNVIDDTGYDCKTCNQSEGHVCYQSEFCKEDFLDVLDSDRCCPEDCQEACVEGETVPCGTDVGECKIGYQICHKKEFGSCINESLPVREMCNKKDDDCDGIIDILEKYLLCGCYNGTAARTEVFDGIDNDCDSFIDENTTCANRGGIECSEDEICPGVLLEGTNVDYCCSEDCSSDCTPDETKPCSTDVGACQVGTIKCIKGKWGDCEGGIKPKNETCNNIDDDCNTIVDDVKNATACRCSDGDPLEELCNNIDDDCDGTIDEQCTTVGTACSDQVKNFDESGIDCGGSCNTCETIGTTNTQNTGNNAGQQTSGSQETDLTGNETIDESSLSLGMSLIYILIFIAVIVIGVVVFEIFHNKNPKQIQTQNQVQQQYNPGPSYNMPYPGSYPRKPVSRYGAILQKSKNTSSQARKLRDKINENF